MEFDEADLHDECKEDTVNYKGVDYATDVSYHLDLRHEVCILIRSPCI